MKINFSKGYKLALGDQIRYISKDKPIAAKKFKADLIKSINKDLKRPYQFKKSIYFDDENIRDYVFKGYTSVYKIDINQNFIIVFGFIKHKDSL